MWVLVVGHPGSGKNVIKDMLLKDEYEFFDNSQSVAGVDPFDYEVTLAMSRLKTQTQASDLMTRCNIVTVNSFWTSFEVHALIAREFLEVTQYEADILGKIYDGVRASLKPPDAIVHCCAESLQLAFDRITLRGQVMHQEKLKMSRDLYRKFAEKIKIPLIDIDATLNQETVQKNLTFSIASIKAANLSGKTIWQRRMFYD